MRKGNGSSAAYYADITRQTRTEETKYNIKDVEDLPKVGSLIVINEIVQEGIYANYKKYRGCVYVQQLTKHGVYVCQELFSETIRHTTCFLRTDFLRGILHFQEVDSPLFRIEHVWADYDIQSLHNGY